MNKDQKNYESNVSTGLNSVQTIYEGSVNARVVERAGNLASSQSKGIAHEIMYADKLNITRPELGVTKLSTKTNAVRDDLVSVKDGVVKYRAQLKDTVSSSGVKKTVTQGMNGKYQGTNFMGTKETTELYNQATKNTAAQKMSSTGISSKDTSRITESFSGKMTSLENIAHNSTRAGSFGAVASVAVGAVEDIVNSESGEEMLAHAAANGARGFASGYVGSAAATVATSATAAGIASVPALAAAPLVAVAAPVAAGIVAATVAGKVVMDATDGEVKEVLEDIGRGVGDFISDAADEVAYRVVDSIGEGLDRVGDKVDDFIDSVSLFFNLF
ncbi:hypothetical protein ACTQ07_00610 [Holdemanella porci]|uniref:hypothetical protein n=1 Tax=Holdemanella porci TaxID=2652276 RepID=UPI003F928911